MNEPQSPVLKALHSVSVGHGKGNKRRVVQFDIELQAGLIYTLQGPNQSGKSTLIKTLMGLFKREDGKKDVEVIIGGQPEKIRSPADAIKYGIVSVFQDDELIPSMTLREQLRLRHARPKWHFHRENCLSFSELDEEASALLKQYSSPPDTNFENNINKLPGEMSGGAMAVARLVSAQLTPNIKVLLLDEIFRGVQASVWPAIVDSLRKWATERRVALLSITHNEEEIIRWKPDVCFGIEEMPKGGGKLKILPPTGYRTLTAGLPLKVRSYPVYDIDQGHDWIGVIDLKIPVLLLADRSITDSEAYRSIRDSLKVKHENDLLEYDIEVAESLKSWESVKDLVEGISDKVPQQDVCIVIVGGGVLLNFAGFVASTLHRGVQFLLVPTTVMAIADVAVGSKTSLNLKASSGDRKHLLGTYANPTAIVVDRRFLQTLPKREACLGLAECLKHGLLQDKDIYDRVLDLLARIQAANNWQDSAFDIAFRVMELKSEVLLRDPWEEKGLGYILLYGHLHAHSLERASGLALSHGLSVYIGIMVELILAKQEAIQKNILAAFRAAGLHEDEQLQVLIKNHEEDRFSKRLASAYRNDPKPHHHGKKNEFQYLRLSEIGEFAGVKNDDVSSRMQVVDYNSIKSALQTVIGQLQ